MKSIHVIGAGRVGTAVAGRLRERSVAVVPSAAADILLLCVPDRAIAEVAASIPPGPWVAHVSGATPLSTLEPHRRRFSLHPLQSFTLRRGPEQLDGAWGAITAETIEAADVASWLATTLGLRPFTLRDSDRATYHAAAAMTANYLVTLRRAAATLLADAGVPEEALDPLIRGVVENGFELTGPIERGDWNTVAAHVDAIHALEPEIAPAYLALAELTARQAGHEQAVLA